MSEVLASPSAPSQVCKKCSLAIYEGHAYELGEDRWHIDCFKCFKCETSLGCNSSFLVLGNGSLVCSKCSYSCKQCHKKIDDLAILTGDQAYCSACFTCRVCKSKIEDLRYARTSKGLFCMACHEELIAKKRKHDLKRKQMASLSSSSRPSPPQGVQDTPPPFLSETTREKTASSASSVSQKSQRSSRSPSANKSLPPAPQEPPKEAHVAAPASSVPAEPFRREKDAKSPEESRPNASYGIEEVNDSDDELHLRRVRESMERRFSESSEAPAGAILDLLDAFSAPHTPVTLDSGHNDEKPAEIAKKGSNHSNDHVGDYATSLRPRGWPGEPQSPHRNLLLLSPSQFHDNAFHSAQNVNLGAGGAGGSAEEIPRPRSAASSPMARANRQARVVETNETNEAGESTLDREEQGFSNGISNGINGINGTSNDVSNGTSRASLEPQGAGVGGGLGGLGSPATPVRQQARSSPPLASPPPRLALPEVPMTPKQTAFDLRQRTPMSVPERERMPRGLGLDVDLGQEERREENSGKYGNTERYGSTEKYGSLDTKEVERKEAERKESERDEVETPPSRKLSVRSKMSLRHRRSVSNGSTPGISGNSGTSVGTSGLHNLSHKLSFLRPRDENSKGHSRHVSEGSGPYGSAFTTPPLPPVSSSGAENAFSSSDPGLLEMRSLKFELHQLDTRRQALLADNMRLNSEKSRLSESVLGLQKRVAGESEAAEALAREVEALSAQKLRLTEENQSLASEHSGLVDSVARMRDELRSLEGRRTSSTFDNANETLTFESGTATESLVDEGAEAQKATRLKFWRRPKVTIANANTSANASANTNANAPQQGSNVSSGVPHSASSFKLGQNLSFSTNSVPFSSPHSTDETHARKALNSFVSKSRSTTILDSFVNGSGNGSGSGNGHGPSGISSGVGNGNGPVPLLTSTLQKRATYENEKVPLIITKCIEEVEARGLDMEGIYRLSGGNSAICAIENAFASVAPNGAEDKRQMARISEVLGGDINAVTSALKRYLRKLPDPLIPLALYDNYIRIGQRRLDPGEFCAEFKTRVLNRLPSANKHALYLICRHLHKVDQYSHLNRMNFKNLSVVFAPTIARDATGEREMIDMGHRNDTTELLFSHFDALFGDYAEN